MMTKEELDALERVVQYVLCNEETHYHECLEEDEGEQTDHIYTQAVVLDNYIRGLYSTGSEPK